MYSFVRCWNNDQPFFFGKPTSRSATSWQKRGAPGSTAITTLYSFVRCWLKHKPFFTNPFSSENRPHGSPQASNNGEPYVPPHSAGPPAVSSKPREPLTGGAEMMDALSEIPVEARQNFWYGRVQVKDQVWHQANDTGFFVSVAKPKVFRTATGNSFKNQCGERRIAVTSSTRSQDQPYTSSECIQQDL